MKKTVCVVLVALSVLVVAGKAVAAFPVPGDLNPGDKYHIVFVSSTATNSVSADIADYNALVLADATAAGLHLNGATPVTWKVIGSTPTVDARDNIGDITAPIYKVNGVRVADDEADLFDNDIIVAIDRDETGALYESTVWTGTTGSGTKASGVIEALGGGGSVAVGNASLWSTFQWIYTGGSPDHIVVPLYAISSEQTVPAASVPAMGRIGLFVMTGLILAAALWRIAGLKKKRVTV